MNKLPFLHAHTKAPFRTKQLEANFFSVLGHWHGLHRESESK